MEDSQTFSPGSLRRAANKMTAGAFARHKLSSLNAPDLVETYPTVFECGKDAPHPGASMWDPEKILHYRPLPFCRSPWAPRRLLLLDTVLDPEERLEPKA
jgi:hypothetical protein